MHLVDRKLSFVDFQNRIFVPLHLLGLVAPYEEKHLLQWVADGDEPAFRQLFSAYHRRLGAFVLGWTKSLPIAEEIVQDTFLKVWENRAVLTGVDNFGAYLFALARNHTYNALRNLSRERIRQQKWEQWLENDMHASDTPIPETYWQLIEEAITKLPPRQQKVFRLKRLKGLKYEQIARELDISPETARKHLAAAQKQIVIYIRTRLAITLLILSTPLLLSAPAFS